MIGKISSQEQAISKVSQSEKSYMDFQLCGGSVIKQSLEQFIQKHTANK